MGTMNLRKGTDGQDVTRLQEGLRKLGFQVEVDGKFGPRTEEAVRNLQSLFGYTVDGIAGEGTQSLIDQQVGYGWNLSLPNAKEIAMQSQTGGAGGQQMGGKQMQGQPMQQGQTSKQNQPMQGQAQGKPMQGDTQGKPMQQGQMQGKPMQGEGKPMQGQTQGKPMQQGQPMKK